MGEYDQPSVTTDTSAWSAWALSRVGNAIDAYVDRQILGPQYLVGGSQQFGMDANGNVYPLGQASGQVIGNVQRGGQAISPILLIGIIALVVIVGSK